MRHPALKRPLRGFIIGLLMLAVAGMATPASSVAAETGVTPATFQQAFANAQPGDTLLLSSGDYGRFDGAMKPGTVLIKARAGADAVMELRFAPASNITIDGLRLSEILISERETKNITIRNSNIPGQTVLRTGELANANILFERNVHSAWDKCDGCGEGRFYMPENTDEPSGITIQYSRFGPGGNSDGILNGSNGTVIQYNEFVDIKQIDGPEGVHAGSLQLYGSKNTVIRGNWFHGGTSGIMSPDGADHELIEDNVIQNTNPYAIQLGSDDGSIIRHNTLPHGDCEFGKYCGIVSMGWKDSCRFQTECDPSRGTILTDNILSEWSYQGTVAAFEGFNLLAEVGGRGVNDLRGKPTYVGGASPTSFGGFRLRAGSLGKGSASDGSDRGARIRGDVGPGAAPFAMTAGTAAPLIRVRSDLRSIAKTGKLRLAVRTRAAATMTLRSSVRPGSALPGYRGTHLRKHIRLRSATRVFKPARSRTITIGVPRSARRTLRRSRGAKLSIRSYANISDRRLLVGTHSLSIKRSRR